MLPGVKRQNKKLDNGELKHREEGKYIRTLIVIFHAKMSKMRVRFFFNERGG